MTWVCLLGLCRRVCFLNLMSDFFFFLLCYGDNWDTKRIYFFFLVQLKTDCMNYQLTLDNWIKFRIQIGTSDHEGGLKFEVLCYFRTQKVSDKEEISTSFLLEFPVSTCRFGPAKERAPALESNPGFKTSLCHLKIVFSWISYLCYFHLYFFTCKSVRIITAS